MTDRSLTRLHAHEMASRLRAGEITATALLEAHLTLIEEQDRAIHAWLAVDAAGARTAARSADERLAEAHREGRAALRVPAPARVGNPSRSWTRSFRCATMRLSGRNLQPGAWADIS